MERSNNIRIPLLKVVKNSLLIIVPLGIYAFVVWYSFGHLGWPIALLLALVFPIILFIPVLIWISVASGLYTVLRDRLRRRVINRRKALKREGVLSPREIE